jgi:hypothetical protein
MMLKARLKKTSRDERKVVVICTRDKKAFEKREARVFG